MKKIIFPVVALFLLVFTFSCENEELDSSILTEDGSTPGTDPGTNPGTNPDTSIEGTWNLSSFSVDMTNTSSAGGVETVSELEVATTTVDYTLILDGSNFNTNGSYTYNTSIAVNGTNVSNAPYTLSSVQGAGTYSTSGNEMTTSGSFFEYDFEGVSSSALDGEQTAEYQISADGQTLTFTQNTTETDENSGVTVTAVVSSTSIWTRESTTDTTCDDATTAATEALASYEEDTSNTTLCNAYKTALENKITACGDADASIQAIIDGLNCSGASNNDSIEGTWLLTAWIGEEAIDLNDDGTASTNFLDEMECYENETLVFNSDETGVNMSTSYADITFEIEVGTTNSYVYTIDCIEEIENTNFTWTQDGNTILTDDGSGVSFEWTLDGNQLSATVPSGFVALNSEDATVTVIQDLTFVYTKQ